MPNQKWIRETILSAEFKRQLSGELLLLENRIIFAIRSYLGGRNKCSKNWLLKKSDPEDLHTFEACCFWLGIQPDIIRKRVKTMYRNRHKKEIKKLLTNMKIRVS